MAKVNVRVSPFATASLKEILDYKKKYSTLKSIRAFRKRILDKIHLLRSFPKLGIREEKLSSDKTEYRVLIIEKYKIIYRIEDTT